MKCIKCGNETQNPDAVCDSCRKAEDVFRRRVRMESEEHVKQVRMEEAYHQTITWKEKMGLNSRQGKILMAALIISAIAFVISLLFSFVLSFLLGHSLSNLMTVNYVNGENYINGFAMLKMAYLNNLKLSVQFSSVGITGEATATGSISILILVLIPFLSFKAAWMIFSKWIYKTQIGERATVGIIVCILIVYTFGFALTSFIPVLWLKKENAGMKLDARMYFTLASSIIGTFFVVLAANILAVRKKNRIKEERKNTAAYIDLKAFIHIAAVYIILSFVLTIVGIILFLSSQAKNWTSFTGAICLLPNLTAASASVISGGGYTIAIQGEKLNAVSSYFPGGIFGMFLSMILVLGPLLVTIVLQYKNLKERMGKNYYVHVGSITILLICLQGVIWKLSYAGIDVAIPSLVYHLIPIDLPVEIYMGSSFWRMALVMTVLSAFGVFLEKKIKKREEMKILFDTVEKYDKIVITVVSVAVFIVMLVIGLFL